MIKFGKASEPRHLHGWKPTKKPKSIGQSTRVELNVQKLEGMRVALGYDIETDMAALKIIDEKGDGTIVFLGPDSIEALIKFGTEVLTVMKSQDRTARRH